MATTTQPTNPQFPLRYICFFSAPEEIKDVVAVLQEKIFPIPGTIQLGEVGGGPALFIKPTKELGRGDLRWIEAEIRNVGIRTLGGYLPKGKFTIARGPLFKIAFSPK